jgi:hypothetical protein
LGGAVFNLPRFAVGLLAWSVFMLFHVCPL